MNLEIENKNIALNIESILLNLDESSTFEFNHFFHSILSELINKFDMPEDYTRQEIKDKCHHHLLLHRIYYSKEKTIDYIVRTFILVYLDYIDVFEDDVVYTITYLYDDKAIIDNQKRILGIAISITYEC